MNQHKHSSFMNTTVHFSLHEQQQQLKHAQTWCACFGSLDKFWLQKIRTFNPVLQPFQRFLALSLPSQKFSLIDPNNFGNKIPNCPMQRNLVGQHIQGYGLWACWALPCPLTCGVTFTILTSWKVDKGLTRWMIWGILITSGGIDLNHRGLARVVPPTWET